jgi:hypothetical protein
MNDAPDLDPSSRQKPERTKLRIAAGCLSLALVGSLLLCPRPHVSGTKRRPAPTPAQQQPPVPRANSSLDPELICSTRSAGAAANRV